MNILHGHISNLKHFEGLSLLEITIDDYSVKVILIDDQKNSEFSIGKKVEVLFKETEVVISKGNTDLLSLQNQFKCEIISIKTGELLSQIHLKFNDYSISSIITTDSTKKLKLMDGDSVTALVKTNEIMVALC
jgi:molybdate transport system regulatory protein